MGILDLRDPIILQQLALATIATCLDWAENACAITHATLPEELCVPVAGLHCLQFFVITKLFKPP